MNELASFGCLSRRASRADPASRRRARVGTRPPSLEPGERVVQEDGLVHAAGTDGPIWRVECGFVRLDLPSAKGDHFAGLALPGDPLGLESLVAGRYLLRATAITQVRLLPWDRPAEGDACREAAAIAMHASLQATQLFAIRSGKPMDRVRGLLIYLAGECGADRVGTLPIPQLRHLADITDLAIETVSRCVAELSRHGAIRRTGRSAIELDLEALAAAR